MQKLTDIKSANRGRPSAHLQRHVVQDLIRATEGALARKTAREITVREISTAAGTSEAMIRYYFGSKEGLLLEIIKDFMESAPHKDRDRLSELCIRSKSIRPLVDSLCDFHYSRPNLIKMISAELFNSSSEVKVLFLTKYAHCITDLVKHVIGKMREAGIYRRNVKLEFLASTLTRLIVAPIMESGVTGTPPVPTEVRNGEWPNFIAETIDTIAI